MPTPKYEREIRALLDKLPEFLNEGPARRPGRAPAPRRAPGRPPAQTQTWWARDAYGMAALLTILAVLGRPALGSVGTHVLAWIAAALVVFALAVSVLRAVTAPRQPKIWRGNVLQYPTRGPWERLAAWWRRGRPLS